jgi:RNA polymerase sigma factor (sigma-70 family)
MDWKLFLYKYSMHVARNRWDADDLTQDAWLKLNEALLKDPERPVTKAFLYSIVRNAWIDVQRKKRIQTVSIEEEHDAISTDGSLLSRELLEQLAERLPPKMAVILLLMDIFDFKAKETAVFVEMNEATVHVTLGRARRRLKELAQKSGEQTQAHSVNPVHFDALVDAFHRRNPYDIYRAYLGLNKGGIQLAQLLTSEGQLHFTFRDPDGNLFHVVAK